MNFKELNFDSKEELILGFKAYRDVQEIGDFNMLYTELGIETTGLTKDQYLSIVFNYREIKEYVRVFDKLKNLKEEDLLIKGSGYRIHKVDLDILLYNEKDRMDYEIGQTYFDLYTRDDKLIKIIEDFDPKYIVSAGEESFTSMTSYPEVENLHKTENTKKWGIPTEVGVFKVGDVEVLFVGQAEVCGNLSFFLFNESGLELAKLLGTDINSIHRKEILKEGTKVLEELKALGYPFKEDPLQYLNSIYNY